MKLIACKVAGAILVSAFTILVSEQAVAQDIATSLDDLMRHGLSRPGSGVYVTGINGQRVKGTVESLTVERLVVAHRQATWAFSDNDIWRIERQDTLKNGILVGLGIGAGAIAIPCRLGGYRGCLRAVVYGSGYIILSGALGGMIDAAMHRVIYRGSRESRSVKWNVGLPTVSISW